MFFVFHVVLRMFKFIYIFKNMSGIKTVFTAESSRHAVSSLNLDMLYISLQNTTHTDYITQSFMTLNTHFYSTHGY